MVSYAWNWFWDWAPWYIWPILIGAVAIVTLPWWKPVWDLLPRPIKAVILFVLTGGLAFLYGRNKGARSERDRQKARDAKADATRREVERKYDALPPDKQRTEDNKWNRPDWEKETE